MGSVGKKLKSLINEGTDPVKQGRDNYIKNDPEIERRARSRARICRDCLEDEPISFLKVEDKRIPTLNGKICNRCGCAAPWLMRQDKKVCERWKE